MDAESSAQNSKSAEKLGGIEENGGENQEKGMDTEAAGGFGGDGNSGKKMDTEAAFDPETLATVLSSDDLQEIPVEYGLQPFDSAEVLKVDLVTLASNEVPKTTALAYHQNIPVGTLSSVLSPTSVTQCVSSRPSPAQTEQKMTLVEKRSISPIQVEGINSFDPNSLTVMSGQRTPSPDGYNWRKYGQKQVKSPLGSRSYYRCTHADCYAKKIECSVQSSGALQTVYKSHHSHDPPQKVNCTRTSRLSPPVATSNKSSVSPVAPIGDSVPSTSPVDSAHATSAITEPTRLSRVSSPVALVSRNNSTASPTIPIVASVPSVSPVDSASPTIPIVASVPSVSPVDSAHETAATTTVKQELADGPEPKKRLKKTDSSCPESPSNSVKKQKVVVHAAGDVGISGDGYRWRKYGQKMVKGNPYPRNYYRCTSAGCPVRKHIEMDRDDKNTSIITYKGAHDHEKPLQKKRHGPPSAPLVTPATPTSVNT